MYTRKDYTTDFADADWLKERKNGIGGSEISTLMGLNPYQTPLQLYHLKTTDEVEESKNIATEMGHILESLVAEKFAAETGFAIDESSAANWIAISTEKPYMRVSPDRLYTDANGEVCALECKTTRMPVSRDEYPNAWFVQLQYQLHVLGLKKGAIAWINRNLATFDYVEVTYVEELGKHIDDVITNFWNNHVLARIEPMPTTGAEALAKYPVSTDSEREASIDALSALSELKTIRDSIIELSEKKERLEGIIKLEMGEAERLVAGGDVLCTWKSQKGRKTFDAKAFKAAYPDLYPAFEKVGTDTRTFKIK